MALRVLEKTKDIGEPQGKSGARKGAQIFSLGGGDHFFHHKWVANFACLPPAPRLLTRAGYF